MHVICLTPVEEGVYNDHKSDNITTPPDGWAYIPSGFPLPTTFPRLGGLKAEEITYYRDAVRDHVVLVMDENGLPSLDENGDPITTIEKHTVQEPYTVMTVTSMTEGTMPEPAPIPEPEPTTEEILNAMLGVNA